ncbi:helix-turn-helix transcriptional regulator [Streptomyces sp. NRRL S-350]|uniref:helix-turn-helix transcriptional regulator n=1 Tax=Streptomyces sp. NRRL S-350 TaxID=1463902 RepID=UPI0004BE7831|nr:helix-turn-helix transcriptional regulator [Streptomyces sp. NRRL S-350]
MEATEEFLSTAYTPMRIGKSVADARARISRQAAGPLSADRLSFGFDMAYDAESLGRVCLISLHAGTLVDRTGGEETVFGPGETFLIAPPDAPYRGEVRSARYTIAMFDSSLLDAAGAREVDTRGRAPLRLTGLRTVDEAANRQLGAAVAYVRDHVLDNPAACEHDLLLTTAAQHLAAVTLATLPHTARTGPAPADRTDATPVTLRKAIGFIETNAERDISLADIAAAAFVTPRALQYAFRRHLDTTPLAYLRRVRLDAAHRALLAADPSTTTVTEIAMRWGFAHPGHFAGLYRDAYARTPGEALRLQA